MKGFTVSLILGPKQPGMGKGLAAGADTTEAGEHADRKVQLVSARLCAESSGLRSEGKAVLTAQDCTGQGLAHCHDRHHDTRWKMLFRFVARSLHGPMLLLGGLGLRSLGLLGESGSFICRFFRLPPPACNVSVRGEEREL